MSNDPPIDNADPVEERNELLMIALHCAGQWMHGETLPSPDHVRRICLDAEDRIMELEAQIADSSHGGTHWWHEMRRVAKALNVKSLADVLPAVERLRMLNNKLRIALSLAVGWADSAHADWDADRESKVGKKLLALAGRMKHYAPDTDIIHATLAEAREATEKGTAP